MFMCPLLRTLTQQSLADWCLDATSDRNAEQRCAIACRQLSAVSARAKGMMHARDERLGAPLIRSSRLQKCC